MLAEDKVIVMDLDGTLCEIKQSDQSYLDVKPKTEVVNKLLEYKKNDFYIILYTSRQMRTHQGNIGKINASTAKDIFTWLDDHHIPYDEIYFGKPWCGRNGFYVDDKAIRPDEFLTLNYQQIKEKLG
jgi:capsule biosynthesis phosphatase